VASAVDSAVDSVAVTEAIEVSGAVATLAVAEAGSVGASVAAVGVTATSAAAVGVVMVAARTVTLRQTPPTDRAVVSAVLAAAVTGETFPVRAVGMAVTVVVAHMKTGPEATEATAAAAIVAATGAATGILDRPVATWSRYARAETMAMAEVETTTDLERTTRASVASKAATRIPENCGATDRTIPKMSRGGYLRPFSSPFRVRLLLHILPLPPGVSLLS
jgi:hypothetical protein